MWGVTNRLPYHRRGWCATEFSIALSNRRVANRDDAAVQRLLRARAWPTNVDEYADMLSRTARPEAAAKVQDASGSPSIHALKYDPEGGVDFTDDNDREVVKCVPTQSIPGSALSAEC